ncbi:MAG: CCA tRNA nucleotidyltransferase [Candidatus Omnitrophica bacterium]|nr:CCA tRNA nucleotidyltransferase [Candidatus Omnitrophota bacterium]
MKKRIRFLAQDLKILESVHDYARRRKVRLYLVGGFLRDMLLERRKENPDFDFCLKGSAISFGRSLSREMRCGFVVLDKEHGACRLVKKLKDRICTLDFTDFRGRTLQEDLSKREITINALSLDLEKALENEVPLQSLCDHYGGIEDLKAGVIRSTSPGVFIEDPLRILRIFSFSATLGFKIEEKTLKLAVKEKKGLAGVSFERVRDELFKIFNCGNSYGYLKRLDEAGILKVVFPEFDRMRGVDQGPYHHLDVWQHSLETLRQMEIALKQLKNNRELAAYLNEYLSGERRRCSLIKLACLLHDIGKPAARRRQGKKTTFHGHERYGLDVAEEISRKLKLSNDEANALHKMILWHLRPGYLADSAQVTARAKFRYFRDTAREAASTLLLSIADQRATRGRLTTNEGRRHHEAMCLGLIKEYFRRLKEKKLPRLIDGNDLMKRFKLAPSPLIGKILREIEEAQAIGRVKTRRQALAKAGNILKKEK